MWILRLIAYMNKDTEVTSINNFINIFAEYYNEKVNPNTYIILNDINLGREYGGGREYFDRLLRKLERSKYRKGRFCSDNSKSFYYSRGYTYGEDSDGEFSCKKIVLICLLGKSMPHLILAQARR